MNEKIPLEPNPEEKLGEFLRRAREDAGLSREQFAHEVRFSTEILDNLENGNYSQLPVRAYVRGYLNTISSRLNLDRDKIMALYNAETGNTRFKTSKLSSLDISKEKSQTKSESESSSAKPIIVLVILLLALLFFVLKLRDDNTETMNFPEDMVELIDTNDEFDSIAPHDTVGLTDEEAPEVLPIDSTEKDGEDSVEVTNQEPVETILKIECLRDSTWVRVKRIGGRTFVRYVHATEHRPRVISHTDTMQVNVGAPEKTRMHINNVRVKIPNGIFYVYNGAIVE